MSKIWFTSDNHFGHTNVIKYCNRPFESVAQMNEEMVERWNWNVAPEDTVYHLGDFSMNRGNVELWLPKLNGRKILVAGNHDACHPVWAKKPAKIERFTQWYLDQGFDEVHLELDLNLGGEAVQLCHLPYSVDHYDKPRYMEYRPKRRARWLLCGHVHTAWKQLENQINVGVDVWNFYPVSEAQIIELMKGTYDPRT
jgi:calcineurin-like phosphoesterase family protein